MRNTVILFRGSSYNEDAQKVVLVPLSLISLSSVIKPFHSIILDGNIHSEAVCFNKIEDRLDEVLCVGISALTGTEVASGLRFASMVKEKAPHVPVIWGGWHVSCLPEESMENPYIDAVVIGPGQKIFPEIVRRISQGDSFENLEGVVTKNTKKSEIKSIQHGKFDLHNYPLPAFDVIDMDFYKRESLSILPYPEINGIKLTGYLYYVTSFGCPFSCGYCCNHSIFRNKWYGYSIDAVLDQLGWLITEKGFNCIAIIDAEFFFKMDRLEYFCDEIIIRGYKFVWDAQASVKSINRMAKKGLLLKLREAGCWRLNIGAETGSNDMLNYINKKITIEDIIECAHALKDSGITGCFNFLFGLPYEKYSDILGSFSLAYQLKKINPDSPLPISFYTPFPNTPIYHDAVKCGFVAPKNIEEWGQYKTSYIELADEIPWRNIKLEKLIYDVLTFYLPLAIPGNLRRGTITMFREKMEKSPWHVFLHWISKIADYRMRHVNFRIRFERKLYNLYCGLSNKQSYRSGKWSINEDD